VSDAPPAPGKRISFAAAYRHGALEVSDPVHVHFRPLRTWTSLAALAILACLLLPARRPARPGRAQSPDCDR